MRVITYQYAYVGGRISLCARHAQSPPEWVPSLGPVEHGDHRGACEVCTRARARDAAELAADAAPVPA